ncbi:replication-relaxation family protein [Streptacidiphilus albus]|uniref:replication-relaxation family protein n=1 Tax=Streptacidiphilus albus TaxID=105425 RepID=UPI0005A85DBF|nr:replication-relaxation family protein [Streptacidiphilus albus]
MPPRATPPVTVRRGPTAPASGSGRRRTPLSALAARLTPRDLWLLDMLAEHTVLTSHHITDLAYTGHRSANRRLHTLHGLGLLDSFRIRQQIGSGPEHYVLGQTGAALLAARHATTPAALGWHPEHASRTAYNPALTHNLGVATLFTQLVSPPADNLGTAAAWWSELRCERTFGDLIHPDGYGRLSHRDHSSAFFVEYDTGTEALTRLLAKLDDYREAARALAGRPLVLFTLHSARREQNLHHRLTGHPALTEVAVATTARDTPADGRETHHPAEAVWLPAGRPSHRTRLLDLPAAWPAAGQPTDPAVTLTDAFPLPAPDPAPPTGLWQAGHLQQN